MQQLVLPRQVWRSAPTQAQPRRSLTQAATGRKHRSHVFREGCVALSDRHRSSPAALHEARQVAVCPKAGAAAQGCQVAHPCTCNSISVTDLPVKEF